MARYPTGAFHVGRTGCYGCVRWTGADGACGVAGYPCTHWGVDLFGVARDVYAPEGGTVVAIGDGSSAPWVGYGPGVVVVEGDSGKFLLMGHLEYATIGVAKGQRVREGQPLARFDRSIAHTHFEVRHALTGPSPTNTMDPAQWIAGERAITVLGLTALGAGAYYLARRLALGVAR